MSDEILFSLDDQITDTSSSVLHLIMTRFADPEGGIAIDEVKALLQPLCAAAQAASQQRIAELTAVLKGLIIDNWHEGAHSFDDVHVGKYGACSFVCSKCSEAYNNRAKIALATLAGGGSVR